METKRQPIQGLGTAPDIQAAWQVTNVEEGDIKAYFANAFNTKRPPVSKVRRDVWAWFPAEPEGGFFPIPLTVSKIGVPSREPRRNVQSFRRMAQKYRHPYHYVEVEVRDTGTNERIFLY
jgi:hypothetical protein